MPAATYRLIVRTGPNPGVVIDLTKEVSMMGRDVTNDVVLGDAEVSRQHARLTRTPAGFVLEDLGSTNGTFVNGDRLAAARVLNAGDLLGLGENVTLLTILKKVPHPLRTTCDTFLLSKTLHETLIQHFQCKIKD